MILANNHRSCTIVAACVEVAAVNLWWVFLSECCSWPLPKLFKELLYDRKNFNSIW